MFSSSKKLRRWNITNIKIKVSSFFLFVPNFIPQFFININSYLSYFSNDYSPRFKTPVYCITLAKNCVYCYLNLFFPCRHELENMREKSSIQLAFSKRQKTDLSTLEFELNRWAKICFIFKLKRVWKLFCFSK